VIKRRKKSPIIPKNNEAGVVRKRSKVLVLPLSAVTERHNYPFMEQSSTLAFWLIAE